MVSAITTRPPRATTNMLYAMFVRRAYVTHKNNVLPGYFTVPGTSGDISAIRSSYIPKVKHFIFKRTQLSVLYAQLTITYFHLNTAKNCGMLEEPTTNEKKLL
jgi:hypothetical protein